MCADYILLWRILLPTIIIRTKIVCYTMFTYLPVVRGTMSAMPYSLLQLLYERKI